MTVILYVDGGTRGSVICLVDPQKKKTIMKKRGGDLTNNDLEYLGIIYGIEYARNNYPRDKTLLYSDSKLAVNQINDEWNVKEDNLKRLHKKAQKKITKLIKLRWTPRENNLAGIYLEDAKDRLK